MLSIDHFIWIGISLFFVGILLFFSRKFKFSFKTSTWILLGIYVASEIAKIIFQFEFIDGKLSFNFNPSYLPLQLCTVTLFFVIYLAFAKNQKCIEFVKSYVVEVMLIGAPLALIFGTCFNSTNTAYLFASFKDPRVYQFFIYHSGMIWYGIYLLITKQVKMGIKPWWQSYLVLVFLILNTLWINRIFASYNTNFMFTTTPPANGIPLLNLKHGYTAYLVHYLFLVALATFILQLSSIIKEIKNKKVSN